MQVLGKRTLVHPEETKTKTESGLTIPVSAQEKNQYGTIVAIGDEVTKLKVDDRVIFGKRAGVDLAWEGKECFMMVEGDIVAIL